MKIRSFRALMLAAGAFVASPAFAQNAQITEATANQGLVLINAQAANSLGFTGAGVTVGVLDSGVDATHPDLIANLSNFSYDGSTGGPVTQDYDMHGTHVAGIIAAARNGFGVQGVAYDAKLALIVPNSPADGDEAATDVAIADVYGRALNANVRIFNNSWGFDYYTGTPEGRFMLDAVMSAQIEVFKRAVALDSVLVFSTGNEYEDQPNTQAGLPYYFPELAANWLAVTAVDLSGEIVDYANRCGLAAAWCLAAPGGDGEDAGIISTVPLDQGGYDRSSGTSMAAPHVTGAVAVARQMFPTASGAELARFVLVTATDVGATGLDPIYGWGLLNMGNMAAARSGLGLGLAANAGWAADQGQAVVIHGLDARLKAQGARGAWGAALGGRSRHDGATASKAQADSLGLMAGYDRAIGDGGLLGAALSWTTTDLDEPGLANSAKVKTVSLAAYGVAAGDVLFVEGSAGAHRRDYTFTRGALAGAAGTVLEAQGLTGRAETDGYGLFADGRIGLSAPLGPVVIRPFVHAQVSHQAFDGFTETGADVFALTLEDVELTRYQAGPGLEFLMPSRAMGSARVSGDLSVRYALSWGDTDYPVAATMLGARMSGQLGELEDPVTLAGGLSAAWGGVEGSLRGFYARAGDQDSSGLSLGLLVSF
ncbi:S8 family serine peptidase [Phenylobacterium sp.]|uniref:S8 family peptidase n=1 Tax=Phenylobacterium sp. TaxID=1871053 RepID=UPI002731757E|nr:S8 family serine peptidase [Phenylobacterium sp.]MDP2212966.1 S8 family serine peptidase [Phenylobacterium sp.]